VTKKAPRKDTGCFGMMKIVDRLATTTNRADAGDAAEHAQACECTRWEWHNEEHILLACGDRGTIDGPFTEKRLVSTST